MNIIDFFNVLDIDLEDSKIKSQGDGGNSRRDGEPTAFEAEESQASVTFVKPSEERISRGKATNQRQTI